MNNQNEIRGVFGKAIVLDDHTLFASAFAGLIKETNYFDDVLFSDSLQQVKGWLEEEKITHLFTDYVMPGVNTLSELVFLRKRYPGLLIVVVSTIKNTSLISQLQKAGADGFISKNSDRKELEECFSAIAAGKYFVSRYLRSSLLELTSGREDGLFTAREYEILYYIASGVTIEETAAKLFLSKHTIVAHRRNMMLKMEVKSVTALLKKAMDLGMI